MMTDVRILCGPDGSSLADEVCGILGVPSNSVRCYKDWAAMKAGSPSHPDDCTGDSRIEIPENVRGRDVYVIQSTCSTPAEHSKNIVELLLVLSALRRSAARRVCAIIPYFAYSRQTMRMGGRGPISAADVSILLEEVCIDHVVTVDIFREQTAGFFSPTCRFDTLSYLPVCARYFWKNGLRDPVIVAPHASTMPKAVEVFEAFRELHDEAAMAEEPVEGEPSGMDAIAAQLGAYQEGSAPSVAMLLPIVRDGAKIHELTGEVDGRDCILVDDIVDTGATIKRSTEELIARGARSVSAFATHGLFSKGSFDRIAASQCKMVVVTNTILTAMSSLAANHPMRRKLVVLSVAPIIAHHVARLSDLPPPDFDPLMPTYALQGTSGRPGAALDVAELLRRDEDAIFGKAQR
ncbi:hypothetical protein AB1Y20_009387 [Prymnesium parvum]|uniref:ribose-phosphate diphosphokinase n=1 Tax=Prymnesium parvum TaxID=97485 RepID=A0AB34K0K8_PRYPA